MYEAIWILFYFKLSLPEEDENVINACTYMKTWEGKGGFLGNYRVAGKGGLPVTVLL